MSQAEPLPTPPPPQPPGGSAVRSIQEFRLAFVLTEVNAPVQGGNTILGSEATYTARFQAARQKGAIPPALSLPWKEGLGRPFWKYYLESEGAPLAAITPRAAWRNFVPLRRRLPLAVAVEGLKCAASHAGYLYPFGQAFVLTLTAAPAGGIALDDVAGLVVNVRNKPLFKVGGPAAAPETLDQVLGRGLAELRTAATVPPAQPGSVLNPFSILTVVRGRVPLPSPVPDPPVDEAVQRVLLAMSTGAPGYDHASLGKLADTAIKLRADTPGHHILYGTPRGRAVWFPVLFTSQMDFVWHKLGSYHRNLVACAAQVESLCELIRSAGHLAATGGLSPLSYPMLRLAVGCLNRLYKGSDTYKTRSTQIQMVQRQDFITAMNTVRAAINWTAGQFQL